jgi:hypothetical protein
MTIAGGTFCAPWEIEMKLPSTERAQFLAPSRFYHHDHESAPGKNITSSHARFCQSSNSIDQKSCADMWDRFFTFDTHISAHCSSLLYILLDNEAEAEAQQKRVGDACIYPPVPGRRDNFPKSCNIITDRR